MFEFLNGFKDESARALMYFLTLCAILIAMIIWFLWVPIPFVGNNLDDHVYGCILNEKKGVEGRQIYKKYLNKDCVKSILEKYYGMEIK